MQTKTVTVPNVSCNHCKMRIEKTLNGLKGVASSAVNVPQKSLTVKWDDANVGWEAIKGALDKLGYPPSE
jgi:copper chaperone